MSHCGGWGTYYYHNCGGDFPVTSPVSQLQSGVESTDNAGPGTNGNSWANGRPPPFLDGGRRNHAIKTLTQPLSASIPILMLLLINLHLYPLNIIWFCLRPPRLLFRLRTDAAGWISPDFMADTRQLWTPDLWDFKCPLAVTLLKFSTFDINVHPYTLVLNDLHWQQFKDLC